MAEVIDDMPRAAFGRPAKYDWLLIFDGQPRRFGPGDFPGSASDFGRQVRAAARARGFRVRIITRSVPEPRVYVQRLATSVDAC